MTQPGDEAAIRQVMAAMEDAWNRHDMSAWSAAFTEDADFVNVAGKYRKGRAEIDKLNAEQHRTTLKDTTQRYSDVRIRFLTLEIAVVHRSWRMSGYTDPAGASRPAHEGVAINVMVKDRGRWMIAAFQNTTVRA
jgi:uncharacterized protein (TIGR02246 family)